MNLFEGTWEFEGTVLNIVPQMENWIEFEGTVLYLKSLKFRALQRALNLRAFRYPQIPSNFEFEVPSNSEVPSNFFT